MSSTLLQIFFVQEDFVSQERLEVLLSTLRSLMNCNTWDRFREGTSPWSIASLLRWLARISVITVQFDVRIEDTSAMAE